jgi:hypothetical protein
MEGPIYGCESFQCGKLPRRHQFALLIDILYQLSEAVGVELVREELVNHYVQLLKDNEAEVRTAAAGQIPGIVITISDGGS